MISPLEYLISRYRVAEACIPFGPRTLRLLSAASMDELLDWATEADEIPFWAEIWASSRGLASYLLTHGPLTGKTILELGAGVGLGGIAAALLGGRVIQTDYIEDALRFAAVNARMNRATNDLPGAARNHQGGSLDQVVADWRAFPIQARFDLIIGADILYDPLVHAALEAILANHLSPGAEAISADPVRRSALEFMAARESQGWQVSLDTLQIEDGGKMVEIAIFHLKPLSTLLIE